MRRGRTVRGVTARGERGLPAVGDVLKGRYRVDEHVGAGAMASVFRGRDLHLGREVAIKAFTARVDELGDRERRQKEARLLATVTHPSLITLYDGNFSGASADFLVLEYVDGGALRSVMDAGPLSSDAVAALACDIGDALRAVHEAGIVHRDVTPGNILLRSTATGATEARAVLSDFGIAHARDAARLTSPGIAVGTAAYMSPEQARGADPHPASDVYALGLVLLEALTGTRAFARMAPIESIVARLTAPPSIPRDLPYGWRTLLTAMTAIDPAERPSDEEIVRRAREMAGGTAAHVALAAAAALEATAPMPVIGGEDAALVAAAGAFADTASDAPDPGSGTLALPRRAETRRAAGRDARRRVPLRYRLGGPVAVGILATVLLVAGWAALPALGEVQPPAAEPTTGPSTPTSAPVEETTTGASPPAEAEVVELPVVPDGPAAPVQDVGADATEPGAVVDADTATVGDSAEDTRPGNGKGSAAGENSGKGNGPGTDNGKSGERPGKGPGDPSAP